MSVCTFLSLRSLYSTYLTELCRPISSDAGHHHLCSAFTRRLIVPCTKTSYRDRSLSVRGPSVWNSLLNDLRLSDMSLETFRSIAVFDVSFRPGVCSLRCSEKKVNKKVTIKLYFTWLPRRPLWTDFHQIWNKCSARWRNQYWQILCRSVVLCSDTVGWATGRTSGL